MTKEQRRRELTMLLNDPAGRYQLLAVLRQQMNLAPAQVLPVGTPIIDTILKHEFTDTPN